MTTALLSKERPPRLSPSFKAQLKSPPSNTVSLTTLFNTDVDKSLNSGENAESIRFWRSVPKDVDPEYYEREPKLGVGPGRPRTMLLKRSFCW